MLSFDPVAIVDSGMEVFQSRYCGEAGVIVIEVLEHCEEPPKNQQSEFLLGNQIFYRPML